MESGTKGKTGDAGSSGLMGGGACGTGKIPWGGSINCGAFPIITGIMGKKLRNGVGREQ
ncbi:hypothetical protein GSbR_12410 [Geobacter sp. SVR]|nr:hypothetical protein GSVR_15630 [Geobacter sp. SVR]GCF84641.1 hypothetical protein GSbR_12410 [Geobacter sp. SVR]